MFSAKKKKKKTRDQHALLLCWRLSQRWAEFSSHGRSLHWADGSSPWSDSRVRAAEDASSVTAFLRPKEAIPTFSEFVWGHWISYFMSKNMQLGKTTVSLSRSWYFFLSIRKNSNFSGMKLSVFWFGVFFVTLWLHFRCQRRDCVLSQDIWKLQLLISVTQKRGSSLCT